MKKKLIFGLLAICCCSVFLLVGCTKDDSTDKVVIKTPMQLLTDRVNTSESTNVRQDNDLLNHGSRIGTLETTVSGLTAFDPAPITARIVALEGLNLSTWIAQISYINLQIVDLADDNCSTRLTALENKVNSHITATPTVNATPTPTANVTPTPTAIPVGLLSKPIAIYPEKGNISVPIGEINFEWSDCNATVYEFYFGNDPTNMSMLDSNIDSDVFNYNLYVNTSDYYYWRIRAIVGTSVKSSSFWFKTQ